MEVVVRLRYEGESQSEESLKEGLEDALMEGTGLVVDVEVLEVEEV
jgi:hypothetical protein